MKLTNAFQHKKVTAELSDFHVVIGPNGSGKSNFIESILTGLGCKFGLPGTKDTMITEGEEKGKVELTLEHEGEEVELRAALGTASRSMKRPGLKMGKSAEVIEYLRNTLLATPFEVVTQSSVIRQKKLTEGLFDTTAKRTEVFMRLAGLREIETKRKLLHDEKNAHTIPMLGLNLDDVETKIKELQDNCVTSEKEIATFTLVMDEQRYATCVSLVERFNQASEAVKQLKGVEDKHRELSAAKADAMALLKTEAATTEMLDKQLTAKAEGHLAAHSQIDVYQSDKQLWDAKLAAQKAQDDAERAMAALVNPGEYTGPNTDDLVDLKGECCVRLGVLYRANDALKSDTAVLNCPTCKKLLTAEEAAKLIKENKSEIAEMSQLHKETADALQAANRQHSEWEAACESYRTNLATCIANLKSATERIEQHKTVSEPASADDAQKVIDEYTALQNKLDGLLDNREELNKLVNQAKVELATVEERLNTLKKQADVKADDAAVKDAEGYIGEYDKFREKIAELRGRIDEMKRQEQEEQVRLKDLKEQQQKATLLEKYIRFVECARGALQRDNFPSGKIKAFIDRMLLQANVYLDVMQAGFSMTYDNDRGFMAYFSADDKYMRADRLSGGQQTVFALAFRFSVHELRSETGFLILDEPTAWLDDHHVEKVVEALNLVKSKLVPRVQVIIVTHDERLVAVADAVLDLAS